MTMDNIGPDFGAWEILRYRDRNVSGDAPPFRAIVVLRKGVQRRHLVAEGANPAAALANVKRQMTGSAVILDDTEACPGRSPHPKKGWRGLITGGSAER